MSQTFLFFMKWYSNWFVSFSSFFNLNHCLSQSLLPNLSQISYHDLHHTSFQPFLWVLISLILNMSSLAVKFCKDPIQEMYHKKHCFNLNLVIKWFCHSYVTFQNLPYGVSSWNHLNIGNQMFRWTLWHPLWSSEVWQGQICTRLKRRSSWICSEACYSFSETPAPVKNGWRVGCIKKFLGEEHAPIHWWNRQVEFSHIILLWVRWTFWNSHCEMLTIKAMF